MNTVIVLLALILAQFIVPIPNPLPPAVGDLPNGYYSTDFSLTENPISESSVWSNGGSVGLDWQNVQTASSRAYGVGASNPPPYDDPTAILKGTWSGTQWVSATAFVTNQGDPGGSQEIELRLLSTMTAHSSRGYEIMFSVQPSDSYVHLARWNGNVNDFLEFGFGNSCASGTSDCGGIVTGDVLSASVASGVFHIYKNGVEINLDNNTDSTFTTGNPGIGFWKHTAVAAMSDAGWSDFTASNGTLRIASSCSPTDIATQITASSNGDAILVPPGSCNWTSALAVNKAVNIFAAGTVTLTCGADTDNMVNFTESTAGVIRWSGFTFESSTCITNDFSKHMMLVSLTASGRPVVIMNNTFNGDYGAIRMNTNRGVIASNTFTTPWQGSGQYRTVEALQMKCEGGCNSTGWGAGSTLGMLDTSGEVNMYFENNTINEHNTEAIDFDGSSRTVVRYNTFNQSAITSHGTDTSTWGNRQWEVYNNTFTFTDPGNCALPLLNHGAMDYFLYIRGGTGLITDNVIGNINSCWTGNKDEIKFTIFSIRQSGAGPFPCWSGGYPAPRQEGMGRVTGTAGDDPNGVYYGDSDPIYVWNNTGAGNLSPVTTDYQPDECGNGLTTASFVQLNRDYFLSARPGYTKYTYPHPLRSLR